MFAWFRRQRENKSAEQLLFEAAIRDVDTWHRAQAGISALIDGQYCSIETFSCSQFSNWRVRFGGAYFDATEHKYLALHRFVYGQTKSMHKSPRYTWTPEFDFRQLFKTRPQAQKALNQTTGASRGPSRRNDYLLQEIALVPTAVEPIGYEC